VVLKQGPHQINITPLHLEEEIKEGAIIQIELKMIGLKRREIPPKTVKAKGLTLEVEAIDLKMPDSHL
jgi:hypothetical protein